MIVTQVGGNGWCSSVGDVSRPTQGWLAIDPNRIVHPFSESRNLLTLQA